MSTTLAGFDRIAYDDRGNTVRLGDQTLSYDGADRHLSTLVGTPTSPVAVSAVAVAPAQTTATVTWTTDVPATSYVDYSDHYDSSMTGTSDLTTTHSVTLDWLACGTSYAYRVRSADAANNEAVSDLLSFTTAACPAAGFESDNFQTPSGAAWTTVDPVGDGTVTRDRTNLSLTVPGGTSHNAWTDEGGNRSLRIMQPPADPNGDLDLEVKFDSRPEHKYQGQGILIEQDPDNWIRFDVHHNGSAVRFFAATVVGGVAQARYPSTTTVTVNGPIWLRVNRANGTWTFTYSTNGTTFTAPTGASSFTHTIAANNVGVMAFNTESPETSTPTWTASVDYFQDRTNPITDDPHARIVRSDDFHTGDAAVPDATRWQVTDPTGDGEVTVEDHQLSLALPGGAAHDIWEKTTATAANGNRALRVTQLAPNGEFTVAAKFDSTVEKRFQTQGILVEADLDNWIRFDVYHDGTTARLFAATAVNGVVPAGGVKVNTPVSTSGPLWLRITRTGTSWTYAWSTNGTQWTTAVTFTHATTVNNVGVFAANTHTTPSDTPAFEARVDTFTVTTDPLPADDTSAAALTADDFTGTSLNRWRWATHATHPDDRVTVADGRVLLTVPQGVSHDLLGTTAGGNQSLRITQPTPNSDLVAHVRFESDVTAKFQVEGILIEHDPDNWMRFEIHHDGTTRRAYAAATTNGVLATKANTAIGGSGPISLRVTRTGDTWTYDWSTNGTTWTAAAPFTHTITVDRVGIFASNSNPDPAAIPAFTAIADWFTTTTTPPPPPTGVTAITYTRDATNRLISRTVNNTEHTGYGYTSPGDSPAFAVDTTGTITERYIALLGGASVTKRASGDTWSYPNIHGDTAATANAAGVKQGNTHTYDPYGQPLATTPDNATGNLDYAWLGQHQRPLEHQADTHIIQMGARPYIPALGRFLQVDPIEGASANAYDYCDADPINCTDLDGLDPHADNLRAQIYLNSVAAGGLTSSGVSSVCKWTATASAFTGGICTGRELAALRVASLSARLWYYEAAKVRELRGGAYSRRPGPSIAGRVATVAQAVWSAGGCRAYGGLGFRFGARWGPWGMAAGAAGGCLVGAADRVVSPFYR